MKISVTEVGDFITMQPGAKPSDKEIAIATILVQKTKHKVEFIAECSIHTPDIIFEGKNWEIKRPEGNGKRTIQHQIHRASLQAENVIIDTSGTSLSINEILSKINFALTKTSSIKHLMVITKNGDILTIL